VRIDLQGLSRHGQARELPSREGSDGRVRQITDAMRQCPKCSALVDLSAPSCWLCGCVFTGDSPSPPVTVPLIDDPSRWLPAHPSRTDSGDEPRALTPADMPHAGDESALSPATMQGGDELTRALSSIVLPPAGDESAPAASFPASLHDDQSPPPPSSPDPADVTPPALVARIVASQTRGASSRRALIIGVVIAAAIAVMAVPVVGRLVMTNPDRAVQPIERAPAPETVAEKAAPSFPVVEIMNVPTWTGPRRATRAPNGSRTIAFELDASSDVRVWMSSERPRLTVRCLSGITDVFVSMGSAASIEREDGIHTVRVQMDNDPEIVERWSGSESSRELFSPNGQALVRSLARARRMRFGFTPFHAAAVTAEFPVQGFEQLVGLVAGTCGWRVDPTPSKPGGSAAARTAARSPARSR
jgi:hypothetical protein